MKYSDAIDVAAEHGIEMMDREDVPGSAGADIDLTVDFAMEEFLELIDDDDPYDDGTLESPEHDLRRAVKRKL